MKSFRIFTAIFFVLVAAFTSTANSQTVGVASTCKVSENEPFRKVCDDKSVQTYLIENFQQVVGQNQELADVSCNWDMSITPPRGLFNSEPKYRITCENKNLKQKIIIGWFGEMKFMQSNVVIGNHLLFLRNKKEDAKIFCVETKSYTAVMNAVMGSNCTLTITPSGDKVSFSVMYLKNQTVADRKLFVAFLNTENDTPGELEANLLKSLAK